MPVSIGVITKDEPFTSPASFELLGRDFEVQDFSRFDQWDDATFLERCRGVEVLISGWLSRRLPDALAHDRGRLRYLLHIRGSIRAVVTRAHLAAGLIVTNWGEEVPEIPEGAMVLLLACLKQLRALDDLAKGQPDRRIWQMYTPRLRGLDVGLYGFGPLGRVMGRMLEPFGARIAVYDPYAREVPAAYRRCATLAELFSTCQAVSIHCGLNDQTRLSVTRELLALLPQGGIVINTARGWIVDEAALAEFVAAGRLLAGLDVIQNESDWPGSPLARCGGAVLTLHSIGDGKGYPPDRRPLEAIPEHALRNLENYRLGRPLLHVITAADYDLKT